MRSKKFNVITDDIANLFSYDAATGKLTRIGQKKEPRIKKSGYKERTVKNRVYKEHRIIWFILYNENPYCFIEHRDRDKSNNRPSNLRLASQSENMCNIEGYSRSSNYKGVHWSKKDRRYHAKISKGLQQMFLGCFTEQKEAALVWNFNAEKLHGSFAVFNQVF